jgi:hypothetical protein
MYNRHEMNAKYFIEKSEDKNVGIYVKMGG